MIIENTHTLSLSTDPQIKSFHFSKVSMSQKFPFLKSFHFSKVSMSQKFPFLKSFHFSKVSMSQKFPFLKSYHFSKVSISQKFPFLNSFNLSSFLGSITLIKNYITSNWFLWAVRAFMPGSTVYKRMLFKSISSGKYFLTERTGK